MSASDAKSTAAIEPCATHDGAHAAAGACAARPTLALRRAPLAVVFAAVAAGVVADRWLSAPAIVWWGLSAIGLAAWLVARRTRARSMITTALLLACAASAAGAWHHARWNMFAVDEIGRFATRWPAPACIEAIADSGPKFVAAAPFDPLCPVPLGERTKFVVRAVAIRDGRLWRRVSGNVSLSVRGRVEEVRPGDRLRIYGHLSRWSPPMNEGEFDFAAHFRADRVLARMTAISGDCLELVERGAWWRPARWLDAARRSCHASLDRYVGQQRSALAGALILGADDAVDPDLIESFFQTGTIHLLSISGLHVAVLALALFGGLRMGWLPRHVGLWLVALVTLVYAAIIVAEPPAIRATMLVLVVCAAMALGRRASAAGALSAAGLVILALNPADLFRVGPQLSFLAAATLAWLGPCAARWPKRSAPARVIDRSRSPIERMAIGAWRISVRSMAVTAGVWAATLPLVLWRFHLMPPASLWLTPILSIPVTAALLCGFVVIALGWIAPPVAAVFGWGCGLSLWIVETAITLGDRAWPSHWWLAGPPAWLVAVCYAVLVALWWRPHAAAALIARITRPRWRIAAVGSLAAGAWMFTGWGWIERPALECTVLAVGHGGATVVRLPDGKTLIYDAGHMGLPQSAAATVSAYLWSRHITRIDALVISHADVDHFNAVPELTARFAIDRVIVAPSLAKQSSAAVDALLASLRAARIPLEQAVAGEQIELEGGGAADYSIRVLHPAAGRDYGADNADSLVLSIEYATRRVLLTGDIDGRGLDALLATPRMDNDVVLAPHHGSRTSNTPAFAAWSQPHWVVVSAAHTVALAPLARTYGAQGADVVLTADSGAISFTLDRDGCRAASFLNGALPFSRELTP